jgi:hypothetical protein
MNFSNIEKEEFQYPCGNNKISCYPIEVVLPAGVYQFECYGASGGISGNGAGGYGAYVSGNITLNSTQRMFLFIGARGYIANWQQSFNGGGRGKSNCGSSGGGSTDIRLVNSTELDGLVSRIIVAAAGGGGTSYNGGARGGNAGIFTGEDGKISSGPSYTVSVSKGGSVSAGGSGGRCVTHETSCYSQFHAFNGGFGFGGDSTTDGFAGGGGSGYFGGGGGALTYDKVGSGAGGSSYISGYSGFHSFKVENGQLKDTNSEKHSSGFIFDNIDLKSGSETKYVGDGKVIITRISLAKPSKRNRLNYSCRDQFDIYYYIFYTSIMVLFS